MPVSPAFVDRSVANRAAGLAELAYVCAQTIVLGLGFTYLVSIASLAAFNVLSGAIYPVAVCLAVGAGLGGTGAVSSVQRRWRFIGIASAVVLLFASPILVARWYDGSFDGLCYHQPAIVQLAEGWNPFRGEAPSPWTCNFEWLVHFPKCSWLIGAVLMKCFGTIEAAKAFNLLAATAAGCLASSLVLSSGVRNTLLAVAAGFVVAANPVVLAQLFSSYNDGFLASLLLLAILASLRQVLVPRWQSALLVVVSIVLCANTKFPAVVYLTVGLLVVYGLYRFLGCRPAARSVAVCWLTGLVLGVGATGADPYLTNTVRHGHPFYPIFGDTPRDIVTNDTPVAFRGMGWGERLARSIFGVPKNTLHGEPAIRAPVIITRDDIFQLANYDLRIGGFGPLFGAALILAALLVCWIPRTTQPWALVSWGCLIFVVVTERINPEAWWARYAPQLWWLPCIVLAAVMSTRAVVPRTLAWCAGILLALNVAVMGGASVGHAYFHSEKQHAAIARLKAAQAAGAPPYYIFFGPFYGIEHRYSAAGIRFVRVESVERLPCSNPENLGGPDPVMRMCPG